ncbi:hypothetical protein PF010_g5020 [Phytophthora fragariae]|nr:hypothetical protein PF009_g6652 [Phytophthora fragariae]KAE9107882.1 hypothetical protein PF007_g12873 [Phytophthora fragariae]KAE9127140.1 hypothetical protein PF010_g5020 [Phytophthora fragariae]KAE9151503.1 hypothetical protein PF006_g4209 [Phytophthora fragariae]KAE9308173.1 hypothetical protein PF001_g11289 [Phytophthora fragariae]
MDIARLLSPSMPPSEPDWGSLVRLLQDSSIPSVSINPAFVIKHSELDNSAIDAIHDDGFEADDQGEA